MVAPFTVCFLKWVVKDKVNRVRKSMYSTINLPGIISNKLYKAQCNYVENTVKGYYK